MEYLSTFETILDSVIGSSDGPTSVFIAGPELQISMGILIAIAVVGILLGFFGLKLIRVLSAIVGLGIGAIIGLVIAIVAELSGGAFIGVVAGCAVVCAVLLAIFKRVGAFFLTLSYVSSALIVALPMYSTIFAVVAAVIAVIAAILAAIFVEPFVIISTSLWGGVAAGTAIVEAIKFDGPSWLVYVLSAALVVVCMMIQFMLQSRKIGKKEKKFAEQFKKEASMESEVERARMILDDEDEADKEDFDDSEDDMDIEIEIEELDLDEK